jgi:hypothetical protein
MKKKDWKHIKDIVDLFLNKEGVLNNDNKINPIIAYAPDEAVRLKPHINDYIESNFGEALYTHVSTLVEKKGRYEVGQDAFLKTSFGETKIISEKESFGKDQIPEAKEYFHAPNEYFSKGEHIRVITFKNSRMEEKEFNDLIELWRTQPRQT